MGYGSWDMADGGIAPRTRRRKKRGSLLGGLLKTENRGMRDDSRGSRRGMAVKEIRSSGNVAVRSLELYRNLESEGAISIFPAISYF